MFDTTERDSENHRVALGFLIDQFREGKIEPLNDAALQEDEKGHRK